MGESVDIHAKKLTDQILELAHRFIPRRNIKHRKMSHPWVTSECQEMTEEKDAIEKELLDAICAEDDANIPELEFRLGEAIKDTNAKMKETYEIYVAKIREDIK